MGDQRTKISNWKRIVDGLRRWELTRAPVLVADNVGLDGRHHNNVEAGQRNTFLQTPIVQFKMILTLELNVTVRC